MANADVIRSLFAERVRRGRQRRFAAFIEQIPRPAGRPLQLLDVGGTWGYWSEMPWASLGNVRIELLNTHPQTVPQPFTAVVGDARDLSRYPDQHFDVVFSNSVIGHVGTLIDQARMAAEIQRVGRTFVLQTPNQYFPIDWRTLVPGFHWLSPAAQAWWLSRVRVGRYPKTDPASAMELATRVRNLTKRELVGLFHRATIERERVFGFTKSFTVRG